MEPSSKKDGSGGLVQFEKSEKIESFILVVKVPNRPELAQIRSGLILLYDSKLLRRLCEINESSRGIAGKVELQEKRRGPDSMQDAQALGVPEE
eukprot:IDg793t1